MTDFDTRPEAAFAKRINKLQYVAGAAQDLSYRLEQIEWKFLGTRVDVQNEGETPMLVGGSLNDDLEMYTDHVDVALKRLAKSVARLESEIDGVPVVQESVPDGPHNDPRLARCCNG